MARRALYLSTALTVLVLAAPAYAASPRENLVEGWLKSLAGSFGTSVKSSSYDPALQMVNLEGVRIGDVESGFELDIETLSVTDPRDAPDDSFAADAVQASGFHVKLKIDTAAWQPQPPAAAPIVKTEAPKAGDAQKPVGMDKPAAAPAAEATPPPPKPVVLHYDIGIGSVTYERLVTPKHQPTIAADADPFMRILGYANWTLGFRADWVEASDLALEASGEDGFAVKTTYRSAFLSGVKEGRAERGGLNGLEEHIEAPGMPSELKAVTVNDAYFSAVDTRALLQALDPTAYKDGKGDGQRRTVYGQYGIDGLAVEMADGLRFSIDNMEVNGLYVRQTPRPLYWLLAPLIRSPEAFERDPLDFASDLIPNVSQLMGADLATVSGISVTSGEDHVFSLGGVELSAIDGNGIGRFAMHDLSLEAKNAKTSGKLDLLAVQDVKFGSLVPFLELARAQQLDDAKDQLPAELIRKALLEGASRIGFAELSGLSVETRAGDTSLGSLAMTSSDFLQNLPRRLDLTLSGLDVPVAAIPEPPFRQELTDMGYDELSLSAGMTLSWNTDTGAVRLEDLTVKARDMGSVSMAVELGNLPLSIFDKPADLDKRAQDGTLVSASFSYGNAGIVEKAFDAQAKKLKQDGDTFRKNTAGAVPLFLSFLNDKAVQKQFEGPVKAFLNDPKSVVVTLQPKAPVPFSVLEAFKPENPAEAFKLLGLDIRANQ